MHAEEEGEGGRGEDRLGHLQAVLEQETKSRQQQEELNSKLQDEYDLLLKKLAQAELHIDQLRLGANVEINKRFILSHQVVRPHQSALQQRGGSTSYSLTTNSASGGRGGGWMQTANSQDAFTQDELKAEGGRFHDSSRDQVEDHHVPSLSFSGGRLDDIASELSPRYGHNQSDGFQLDWSSSNNGTPRQSLAALSDSNPDESLSQMSTGYVATQASAESQHLSQVLQVRSLRESIAALKDKLHANRSSLEELSDDLGSILDEHEKLTKNFSESTKQLDGLKQKYKDRASTEISRRKKTFESELLALADQLREVDDLIRAKTAQKSNSSARDSPPSNSSPAQHEVGMEAGGWAREGGGEMSDDSLNSCSLPSRYLQKKSTDSTSHSPFSDIVGLESLSNSPEQALLLAGSSQEREREVEKETEITRWQQSSRLGDQSGGKGRGVDCVMEPRSSGMSAVPVSDSSSTAHSGEPPPANPTPPLPTASRDSTIGTRGRAFTNTPPFRSRIPLRTRGSISSTHNLPLYRSSPRHTPYSPIKRNMGTIKLRKMSSPAILEASRVVDDLQNKEYPSGSWRTRTHPRPHPFPVGASHRTSYRSPQYYGEGAEVTSDPNIPPPPQATPPPSTSYMPSQESLNTAPRLTPTGRDQLQMARGAGGHKDGSKLTAAAIDALKQELLTLRDQIVKSSSTPPKTPSPTLTLSEEKEEDPPPPPLTPDPSSAVANLSERGSVPFVRSSVGTPSPPPSSTIVGQSVVVSTASMGSLIPVQAPITLTLPNSDTSIPTPVSLLRPQRGGLKLSTLSMATTMGAEPLSSPPRSIGEQSQQGGGGEGQDVPRPFQHTDSEVTSPWDTPIHTTRPGVRSGGVDRIDAGTTSQEGGVQFTPPRTCGMELSQVAMSTQTSVAGSAPNVTPIHTYGMESAQISISTQTCGTESGPQATPVPSSRMECVQATTMSTQTSAMELSFAATPSHMPGTSAAASMPSQTFGMELVSRMTSTHVVEASTAAVSMWSQTSGQDLAFEPTPSCASETEASALPNTIPTQTHSIESSPDVPSPTHNSNTMLPPVTTSTQTSLSEPSPNVTPTHTSRMELVPPPTTEILSPPPPPAHSPHSQHTLSHLPPLPSRTDPTLMTDSMLSSEYASAASSAATLSQTSSYKTTPCLTETGSLPGLGLSFTESQLGTYNAVVEDAGTQEDAASLSSFGIRSDSPNEDLPPPSWKARSVPPAPSRERARNEDRRNVYHSKAEESSRSHLKRKDKELKGRKSSKSQVYYHHKDELSSSLALSTHITPRAEGKGHGGSKRPLLKDAWTQVEENCQHEDKVERKGVPHDHSNRSPYHFRSIATLSPCGPHYHHHHRRPLADHTPSSPHPPLPNTTAAEHHSQYSDFCAHPNSSASTTTTTTPVHTSSARNRIGRPFHYITPIKSSGRAVHSRGDFVTSSPIASDISANSEPSSSAAASPRHHHHHHPMTPPLVFPSATVSPIRSHVFSTYSTPQHVTLAPTRRQVVQPSATLSVSPVHSHLLSPPPPSPAHANTHRHIFVYRHPTSASASERLGRTHNMKMAPPPPHPGSSPEEDKYVGRRRRREAHYLHSHEKEFDRSGSGRRNKSRERPSGSAQTSNEVGADGAQEVGGRDPLLVVNIHKPREGGEVQDWGRDAGGRGRGRRTPNNGYMVNHEATSSDEDLDADELGSVDLKSAVRLARQLRRRSERMRGTLLMELTKHGLL